MSKDIGIIAELQAAEARIRTLEENLQAANEDREELIRTHEETVGRLESKNYELREALEKLIDIAKQVDGWESFPMRAIEGAEEVLEKERG